MARFAEGAPCWADVTLPDLAAGKRFYGELFEWTFDEEADEAYGYYTNAFRDGKRVAGLVAKRDGRMPTAWGIYFATSDAIALTTRIEEAGGRVIMAPMQVGPYGTMAVAADPGGAVFGIWQAGAHAGFERIREPGSFCWTEVNTRDKERVDPFYESLFGFVGQDVDEEDIDYRTWSPVGSPPGVETALLGRNVMGDAFPPEMPPHFLVYLFVEDCDGTADEAARLGGRISAPPVSTTFGRIAVLADNQGASFAVLEELE
ncbi:VOC family protein [Streptomyces sannanensis]|uniref:VOC family protein n=1 Tax=Streptomyces sannanensis TaxID=285536 RepID=A0ABP6SBP5_9ACTN